MRNWLKDLRKEKGYTQEDLSREVGISRSYYTQLERGYENKQPSTKVAKELGRILGCDWTIFYEDDLDVKSHFSRSV